MSRADRRWSRLVGVADSVRQLEDSISRVAMVDCRIVVTGETGSGKEEAARAIHAAGPRRDKPFVSITCGGLVAELGESQLFGHERGAFPGAFGATRGAFRAADGGVVFLDEIGDLAPDLQAKLLRVLRRREVTPLGSDASYPIDVQVIAATSRDLDAAVAGGGLREELLDRLAAVHLRVPPLRSRREDIPRFIEHFAAHYAREYGRSGWQPDAAVVDLFVRHPWPGNVRQLARTVQRVFMGEDRVETVLGEVFGVPIPAAAPPRPTPAQPDVPRSEPPAPHEPTAVAMRPEPAATAVAAPRPAPAPAEEPPLPTFDLEQLRRLAVRQALAFTGGHRGKAAALLGVSLNTMTRLVAEACPDLPARSGRKRSAPPRRPK